jgi:membrane associated rhomboid family serine protease
MKPTHFETFRREAMGSVSAFICVLCVVTFFVFTVLSAVGVVSWHDAFRVFGLSRSAIMEHFRIYQFATAPLVHGNLLHLCFNMLTLWCLGPSVEAMLGRKRYIFFSLVCAFAAELAFLCFSREPRAVVIGYSAVIYGILVGQALFYPNSTLYVFAFFPLKMKHAVFLLAGVELYFTLLPNPGGVGHVEHIFGAGAALIFVKCVQWRKALQGAGPPQRHVRRVTMKPIARVVTRDIPGEL